jgi:hypothetical protein
MDFSVELQRSKNLEFNLVKLDYKLKPSQSNDIGDTAQTNYY